VPTPRTTVTERLTLSAMTPEDADDLFPIFSDPDGWWYAPEDRHATPDTSRSFCERAAARWETDGLSYWTARRTADGAAIGCGGVQRHRSGSWNLSYRVATAEQGNGYATELAAAAIAAARAVDPSVPVIAWIAANNGPSRRVAERLGLREQGLRLDANDGQRRLAYADRDLDG
jgi:RimJ/RimL family protein N-acetyltransferase